MIPYWFLVLPKVFVGFVGGIGWYRQRIDPSITGDLQASCSCVRRALTSCSWLICTNSMHSTSIEGKSRVQLFLHELKPALPSNLSFFNASTGQKEMTLAAVPLMGWPLLGDSIPFAAHRSCFSIAAWRECPPVVWGQHKFDQISWPQCKCKESVCCCVEIVQSAHPSARRILTKGSWSTYCSYLQMQSHLQLWALQSRVLASHRVGGRMNGGGSERADLDLCACTNLSNFALYLFVCLPGCPSMARIRTFLTFWVQVKMHFLNLLHARLHPFLMTLQGLWAPDFTPICPYDSLSHSWDPQRRLRGGGQV